MINLNRSYLVPLFTFEEPTASGKEKKFQSFLRKLYSPSSTSRSYTFICWTMQYPWENNSLSLWMNFQPAFHPLFFCPILYQKQGTMQIWYYIKKVWEFILYKKKVNLTTNLVRTSLPQTNTLLVQLVQIMFGGSFLYALVFVLHSSNIIFCNPVHKNHFR